MTVQTKIQSIDQKITDLKKRKAQMAQKHLQALARLIEKCGLSDLSPEVLAGALLEIKQQIPQKQEVWQQAGATFLESKKSTNSHNSAVQNAEN